MAAIVAADLVAIAHGVFVLFAVLGGWLVFRNRRWVWLHCPAFLWAGWIELTNGICPLTPLENRLRMLGGKEVYGEGFIEHALLPLLYPEGLTPRLQIGLGIFVLLLNVTIYGIVWYRSRRTKRPA